MALVENCGGLASSGVVSGSVGYMLKVSDEHAWRLAEGLERHAEGNWWLVGLAEREVRSEWQVACNMGLVVEDVPRGLEVANGRQAEGISKIALSCMLPGVWQDSQLGNGTGGGDSFGGNGSEAAWCDNVSVKMMGSQVGVERYWSEAWQQIDGMRRLDGWLGWQNDLREIERSTEQIRL